MEFARRVDLKIPARDYKDSCKVIKKDTYSSVLRKILYAEH